MPASRPLMILLWSLFAAGLLYRLWPLAAGMPALSTFFLFEDGYIMLTVARNMAIGLGMSVSDGTIATNGVQPLATFLFTLPFRALEGDKVASLYPVHLMLAAYGVGAFFAIRALARQLMPADTAPAWPLVVALLWFLGPLLLRHSMNGLETGLCTLTLLVTLLAFGRLMRAAEDTADGAGPGARLLFGLLCGLAVLARIDAAFLVAALFAVWAWDELFTRRRSVLAMCARLVPPGLASLAVAAPWLIHNQIRFGSIMPISGTSQSHLAAFGDNLEWLPSKLFETLAPMLPLPRVLELALPVQILCLLLVALCLGTLALRLRRRGRLPARRMAAAYGLFALALITYYGLFFGAAHFLSRYFAPLAPLFILAGVETARALGQALGPRLGGWLAPAYGVLGLLLCLGFLARALMPGVTLLGHEQVLAWTAENVPEEAWVAAPQTGALGYWHDRTINLDGKTNINALQAHWRDGHILNYLTDSPADYVVDWVGMADWIRQEAAQEKFAAAFELVIEDYDTNLAVLRRITPRYQP